MSTFKELPITSNVSVLVLSCDKYSDLWSPFFELFWRFWPDCPFKVFLLSNNKLFLDDRVTTIRVGPDTTWSKNLRTALQSIQSEYVLLMLEDAMIDRHVDNARVLRLITWLQSNKADYLRLRPAPKPDYRYEPGIGRIEVKALWRASIFLSIWRIETLKDMLVDEESAWEFEINGSIRSRRSNDFFSVWKSPFHYIHCVEKGVWIRKALKQLVNMGVYHIPTARKIMTRRNTIFWKINILKGIVLDFLPVQQRSKVLKNAGRLYKILKMKRTPLQQLGSKAFEKFAG